MQTPFTALVLVLKSPFPTLVRRGMAGKAELTTTDLANSRFLHALRKLRRRVSPLPGCWIYLSSWRCHSVVQGWDTQCTTAVLFLVNDCHSPSLMHDELVESPALGSTHEMKPESDTTYGNCNAVDG
jgi:hypothetical protein